MLATKDKKGEPVKIMYIVTAKEPGARLQLDYKLLALWAATLPSGLYFPPLPVRSFQKTASAFTCDITCNMSPGSITRSRQDMQQKKRNLNRNVCLSSMGDAGLVLGVAASRANKPWILIARVTVVSATTGPTAFVDLTALFPKNMTEKPSSLWGSG